MMKKNNRYKLWMLLFIAAAPLLLTAGGFNRPGTDPFAIIRPDAVFESVFSDSLIERRVTSWYHSFYLDILPENIRKHYSGETWREEQLNYLRETADAGMDGPFSTWSLKTLGEPVLNEMYSQYGMKFPYYAHHSGHYKLSRDAGASFVLTDGQVACWDRRYMDVAGAATGDWLEKYGRKPWLSSVIGRDEPLNLAAAIRMPAVVDTVNSMMKDKYGITLKLSPGDSEKSWDKWPTDPSILSASPHDAALLRIAVWRWLNEQLYHAAAREHELVLRYAPGVPHFAYNRNAINIMDPLDRRVMYSLDFLDQSILYDVTDGYSADPYPAAVLERDGRARALYHVGFVSKLVTDLAAGKPTKMILQGFKFHGRLPSKENLREWVSQAAKAGVTHIEWYTEGCPRFVWPEVYAEMLRLSRLWKDMPALAIPGTAKVAVMFSDDSRAAMNDAGMDSYYMLHVLLGEKLGVWFRFVGENHIRDGLQTLDDATLIFAPQLSYVSKRFVELLIDRVGRGAILVILDPDALMYDIETGTLESLRIKLFGAPAGKSRKASSLIPTQEGRGRFGQAVELPVQKGNNKVNARTLNVPDNAHVLFTYRDGSPAVYSRALGKGEVLVFGVMPFGNCELAVESSEWETLCAALIDEHGIDRGLPVWRFLMPAKGGEIRTFELLMNRDR